MSGIAMIIPNVDFSEDNIGQVTLLEDVDVESISISGSSVVEDATAQYSVEYTPSSTSQVGVIWSMESGGQYASISDTGLLTITEQLSESVDVVIKAVSLFNPSVYATKTVRLSSGAVVPVSVTYVQGSRKTNQNGINSNYTNMVTFDNNSLLNWQADSYKVTIDDSYKAYFCLCKAADYRCGARSATLYETGEYNVSTIMDDLMGSLDRTQYNLFALVVVDKTYNPSGATGPNVDPAAVPSHVTIVKI